MSFLSEPLQNILIKPSRMIGTISVQVVVSEQATDKITITKQPVQQGASIGDHAYKEPVSFAHTIYFSNNNVFGGASLDQIYKNLLALQTSFVPFDIVTPKRIYSNMLLASLTQTTDKLTENCLAIHASYEQIIIVPVLATTVPRVNQKTPARTGATQNTGNKSILFQGATSLGIPTFSGGG